MKNKIKRIWIYFTTNDEATIYDSLDEVYMDMKLSDEVDEFVERSAYDRAIDIHRKNANEDYRGNRNCSSVRSHKILKELGETI